MKRMQAGLALAAGLLGVMGTANADTSIFREDFNDGIPNASYWRVDPDSTGVFLEQNGLLTYATYSADDAYAIWERTRDYVLIDRDQLEIVFTLRIPLYQDEYGESLKFGVGFRDVSDPVRQVSFLCNQINGTRWFMYDEFNGVDSTEMSFGPRSYPKKVMLRLRYNNRTRKATMAYKLPFDAVWSPIGSGINLSDRWGMTTTRTLRPFIIASSTAATIDTEVYCLDNFVITYKTINTP